MKQLKFLLTIATLALLFGACNKENSTVLKTTQLSMQPGTAARLVVEPNIDGCTFVSSNGAIATVTTTGWVIAKQAGTVSITVKKDNEDVGVCAVTIAGAYVEPYREPYLNFGATPSQIKTYETRTLLFEDEDMLAYFGENTYVDFVMYLLEDEVYTESAVLIPDNGPNKDLLLAFLNKKYIYDGEDEDIIAFVSEDMKTAVIVLTADFMEEVYHWAVYLDLEALLEGFLGSNKKSNLSNGLTTKEIREAVKKISQKVW